MLTGLVLLALIAFCAAAEEEQAAMRVVACSEQGFSTLCRPEYDYDFHPDGGLTITLREGDDAPWVSIFKTDAPGADFDVEYYLTHTYGDLVESSYADEMIDAKCTTLSLGGKELPVRMFTYIVDGEGEFCLCAIELQDDYFVRYEMVCHRYDIEIEAALTALGEAVGNFRPDPDHYSKASTENTGVEAPCERTECP